MSTDNVTPIRPTDGPEPPEDPPSEPLDTSELDLGAALDQAQAIVQLLQVAEDAGRLQVNTRDEFLGDRALNQALWALNQELSKASRAWGAFLDGLRREQERRP